MASPDSPSHTLALSWLRDGLAVPLACRLPDSSTPTEWLAPLLDGGRWPFLLESARPHPVTGRYSFLGCDPTAVIRGAGSPFEPLRAWLRAVPMAPVEGLPPFVGGAVGVLGYDAAHHCERLPRPPEDGASLPEWAFGLYETIVAVDHLTPATWLITRLLPGPDPDRQYAAGVARLTAWRRRLEARPAGGAAAADAAPVGAAPRLVSTHTRERFSAMVRAAQRWIAAGEIYQANLSQRLSAPYQGSPWALYQRLRAVNPSPFAGYLDLGDVQLICGSPERLVRLEGPVVEARPMAGTRPRTGADRPDRRLRAELLAHPKERAEHLMLVDLARNDLGRVCAYGSVGVDELMAVEGYSHVFHLVSNVRGRLAAGRDWADLVAAVFPGGTITGCPKIRAIQCIAALEPVRRHWYTGSLGYVSFTGAMDFNILIRSAVVAEGQITVQAGAGIVADSDPGREYHETWQKARALLIALAAPQEAVSGVLASSAA